MLVFKYPRKLVLSFVVCLLFVMLYQTLDMSSSLSKLVNYRAVNSNQELIGYIECLVEEIDRVETENQMKTYYKLISGVYIEFIKTLQKHYKTPNELDVNNLINRLLKYSKKAKYLKLNDCVEALIVYLQEQKNDFNNFRNKALALLARLELLIESKEIKEFKRKTISGFENELQAKIKRLQSGSCLNDDTLEVIVPYEANAVGCGFGCQMHCITSGFVCAADKNRMFIIRSNENSFYFKYFQMFNASCQPGPKEKIYLKGNQKLFGKHLFYDGSTYSKRYFKNDLSNEFLAKVKSIDWVREPYAWVHGQILKQLFEETQFLKQYVSDYVKGLGLSFDNPFVGMNIRRGLKVSTKEAKSYEFKEYMDHAKDFYDKYCMKHPDKLDKIPKIIFVSTEEPNIITEMKNYPEYTFIYNETSIRHASNQMVNKINYVWDPLMGIVDMLILTKADLVIATHSSNFARLVYENMHVNNPDPFYKFISLDKDYFVYGYDNDAFGIKQTFFKLLDIFNL